MNNDIYIFFKKHPNMNAKVFNGRLIDPLLKRRNNLLSKLDMLIDNNSLLNPEIYDSFTLELESFSNEIKLLDKNLNEVIISICSLFPNETNIINSIAEIIYSHSFWIKSIERLIFIIKNNNEFNSNIVPESKSIYRMKLCSQNILNDFPIFNYYKKYSLCDSTNILFVTDGFENYLKLDQLDMFDFIVLRSIFVFYSAGINKISYCSLFKYISGNNPNVVTCKQINLLEESILKLKKTNVIVQNVNTNQSHKEKLLYSIDVDNSHFLVLRDSFIYRISIELGLYTELDDKVFNCPISMTRNNICVREYLVYKILLNDKTVINLNFDKIYYDFKTTKNQNKKKLRDIILRILEYWKECKIINYYEKKLNNNKFCYITISK